MDIKSQEKTITEEEIKSMIKTAEEEGSIKEIEKKMIHSIFEFDDINVDEIATPRADMTLIESKASLANAINIVLRKNFSRIPVYEKNRDHIVGIIYAKDLMLQMSRGKHNTLIKKIMKQPYFVPESKKISNLLRQFQKRKEHMAIVIDEHGSVTGLITMEDVLEEIVGEIMDETDKIDPHIKKLGNNVWIVNGKTELEEINDILKIGIKGKDYDTISAFILQHTEKIPNEGEEIDYDNFKLKIEEIESNRISKVKIEKK